MASLPTTPLDDWLAEATRLYSVPSVAMEVVRLADEPTVDATAIRDCVARDPALTAKLLRVVNSSVYGLRGEVGDLNQAIALLGVTPLKLLVLGFCLPENLLADVSADALRRYWTETLTRAAAARAIAALRWEAVAEEAYLAALLQSVGQLVLLSQLGESYANVLQRFDKQSDGGLTGDAKTLAVLEVDALGFDHRALTAELLRRWSLPSAIVEAIAAQVAPERIRTDGEALPLVLRLADLLTKLVGSRQIAALPALVEEGEAFCGLTRREINTLVEALQPRVEALAEAMAVELQPDRDYRQTLVEAHAQMAVAAEAGVGRIFGGADEAERSEDDALCEELLADARDLSEAVRAFLARRRDPDAHGAETHAGDRAAPRRPHHQRFAGGQEKLLAEARRVAAHCRSHRAPLTLVLIGVDEHDALLADATPHDLLLSMRRLLEQSPWSAEIVGACYTPLASNSVAVLLPAVERHVATRLLTHVGDAWDAEHGGGFDAGVASIAVVSKGFDAAGLVAAAERCLSAAKASATAAVKSIEVY